MFQSLFLVPANILILAELMNGLTQICIFLIKIGYGSILKKHFLMKKNNKKISLMTDIFSVQRIKSRAWHMEDKCSTT